MNKQKSTGLTLLFAVLLVFINFSCKKEADKLPPSDSVTDIDGNVYTTVTIGSQVWMVQNLKTTKYRNGDAIPNVTGDTEWANLLDGAYCNLENNASNATKYGRLYNWYAVNDSRNIAPEGWRVATDEDWTTLVDYFGGSSVAGGKLKESGTSHWCNPNIDATNESGFTALPGGLRTTDLFLPGCAWAVYWSSTAFDDERAYNRMLFDSSAEINRVDNDKKTGMSVRCIKN